MEYITVENGDFVDVMRELRGITNSGVLVKKVISFIDNNHQFLSEDEYYKEKMSFPKGGNGLPEGAVACLLFDEKYSLNIKKTTIIFVAFLLDLAFFNGIASLSLNIVGFSTKTLQKIKLEERCLLLDIKIGKKKSPIDFCYHLKSCVQNDIECKFREGKTCKRTISEIESQIAALIEKEVLSSRNGKYFLTF